MKRLICLLTATLTLTGLTAALTAVRNIGGTI